VTTDGLQGCNRLGHAQFGAEGENIDAAAEGKLPPGVCVTQGI